MRVYIACFDSIYFLKQRQLKKNKCGATCLKIDGYGSLSISEMTNSSATIIDRYICFLAAS